MYVVYWKLLSTDANTNVLSITVIPQILPSRSE